MRKVIFTEAQLKNILGDNYDSALNEIDNDLNRSERVYSTSPTVDDSEYNCGPVGDKIGKEKTNGNSLFPYYRATPSMTESKKKLNEVNRDFADKDIYIPSEILDKYEMPQVDCTLAHVKRDGYISPTNAYKEISEYQKGLNTLPEEIIKWLQRQLDILEYTSKQRKERKASRGETNVYQKEGGRRQSGNGKSHSKKNPTVSYYK